MRIIICDDDTVLAEEYIKKLGALAADNDLDVDVRHYASAERLMFELSEEPNDADLIYMDINFEEKMDGIAAANQLRDIGYKNEIVFLTVDRSRVFESFDAEPFHYIVKNATDSEKFTKIFLAAAEKARARKKEIIALSCAGDNRNIPVDSILYFEVVRRVIEVHYDDEIFEFYSTIGKLENMLIDRGFIRVHRAYLAAAAHIASVKSSELSMDNGDLIPVGRTYSKALKEYMNSRRHVNS